MLAVSPVIRFGQRERWHFDVALPKDAERIVLLAESAGDGNKSDHADWCDAGFLLKRLLTAAEGPSSRAPPENRGVSAAPRITPGARVVLGPKRPCRGPFSRASNTGFMRSEQKSCFLYA